MHLRLSLVRVCVVCGVDCTGSPLHQLFRDVHDLFVETMANPFTQLNTKIESTTFQQRLASLAKASEQRSMQ